jgi:hypothetical protein
MWCWLGGNGSTSRARSCASLAFDLAVGNIGNQVATDVLLRVNAAYRLCIDRVLDIVEVGEIEEPGTFEVSVYDLLLESCT